MSNFHFIEPAYLQILSLGVLWVFVHCSPMCGPIVGGLQLSKDVGGRFWKALILYQTGRGIIYLAAGAVAGWMGSGLLEDKPEVGWLVVGVLLLMAVKKFLPSSRFFQMPNFLVKASARLIRYFRGPWRPFFFGMVLGFLPCMLTFWVLTLAAETGNPISGAICMLLLILITSIPIGFSIFSFEKISKFKFPGIEKYLLLLSTAWASMMTLAATEVIDHLGFPFVLFGKRLMLMLW